MEINTSDLLLPCPCPICSKHTQRFTITTDGKWMCRLCWMLQCLDGQIIGLQHTIDSLRGILTDQYFPEDFATLYIDRPLLNFGKYAKLSIAEVFATDVGYAKWLYSQELLIGSKPAIKEFLRSKFQGTDMSYVLSWGKHKNRTINWVKKEDPKYIDWLSSNAYVNDNCPKLKKMLAELLA